MNTFVVIKSLGEGSYGSALLCHDAASKKQYVIKKIPLLNLDALAREAALKEVEVLSRLKHPNIISYHKSFEEDSNLYIVTDYCDGGDLYSKIRSQINFFKENQILDWFVQICLSIKHLHDRKILHRDIKTQNIFLTKSGIAKLGDFGIARILSNTRDLARTCIGTPYYLSPEICENKPYNYKSDIWALGCVLFELTTLKHAFQSKNIKDLFFKILKGTLPQIPDIYSTELKLLLNEIFNRNPQARPTINAILKKPIIVRTIHRLLEEKKTNVDFIQSILQCDKKPFAKCTEKGKPHITSPAAKYGMSIGRKKITMKKVKQQDQSSLIKNVKNNVSKQKMFYHCNELECNMQSSVSGESSKRFPNSKYVDEKENLHSYILSRKDSIPESSICEKSIVDISAIELCEKTTFPNLPCHVQCENPPLKNISFNYLSDSDNSEASNLNIKNTDTLRHNPNIMGIKSNLPEINVLASCSRSKWTIPSSDYLDQMPLEATASEMELTSSSDNVVVFGKRPHSAPHPSIYNPTSKIHHCDKSVNNTAAPKIAQCDNNNIYLEHNAQSKNAIISNCQIPLEGINCFMESSIHDSEYLNFSQVGNTFNPSSNKLSSSNFNEKTYTIEGKKKDLFCMLNSENSSMKNEAPRTLPVIIQEPLFQETQIHDHNNYSNSNDYNNKHFLLPCEPLKSIKNQIHIFKNDEMNKPENLHLPIVNEDLEPTSTMQYSQRNKTDTCDIIPKIIDAPSSVFDSTCAFVPTITKTNATCEMGVQCDLIDVKSLICSPSRTFVPFDIRSAQESCCKHTKFNFQSLPNLSDLAYQNEFHLRCLDEPIVCDSRQSDVSLNEKNNYAVESSKSLSSCQMSQNSGSEDDLFYMCQTLKEVSNGHQSEDKKQYCSSHPTIESYDDCNEIEQLRVEIEQKLGLNTFLKVYNKIRFAIESAGGNISINVKEVSDILGSESEHIINEIFQLINKEEIFQNIHH